MFILHIALQGCVRARNVSYGLTPDTGGHIKYLLELVAAAERSPAVQKQQIVVRRFVDEALGLEYGRRTERISPSSEIVRLDGCDLAYRSKEEMGTQIDALAKHLAVHLQSLDRLPDVIHAHYADAGALALRMKRRFGIPFVFTAHSLGRVKQAAEPDPSWNPVLAARIATEDEVVAHADRIVVSSSNEKTVQYGLYPKARPDRIRINPPGCDLSEFEGDRRGSDLAVEQAIAPLLRRPDRPTVLALARPVRKKNLAALVKAFGETAGLRDRANLVLFAGCRRSMNDLDAEGRDVLSELFALVERYDLQGHVALPETHEQSDVPAIYRYAAERGGLFVNPALNEPFGLTLLEAAASGLPVVATDSGGPVDIVRRCENGRLVPARDEIAIGAAIEGFLDDRASWNQAAQNGLRNVAFFNWNRHVKHYVADLYALLNIFDQQVRLLPMAGRQAFATGLAPRPVPQHRRIEAG